MKCFTCDTNATYRAMNKTLYKIIRQRSLLFSVVQINLFQHTACLGHTHTHTVTQFAHLVLNDMPQVNTAGREEEKQALLPTLSSARKKNRLRLDTPDNKTKNRS
jgi:hypothetical protein